MLDSGKPLKMGGGKDGRKVEVLLDECRTLWGM